MKQPPPHLPQLPRLPPSSLSCVFYALSDAGQAVEHSSSASPSKSPQGPHPALIRMKRKKKYSSSSLIILFSFCVFFFPFCCCCCCCFIYFWLGKLFLSLFIFYFFANKRWALYCRKILTSSRFSTGLDVMVALLKGLQMNTKSLGWEEKQNKKNLFFFFFFNIKDLLRSTELSQCDCKYHFYGIKLGIGSPDRFVSSLILHVSQCVRVSVCACACVCVCGSGR